MSKQKLIPEYLEEYSEGLKEVCKKLDLILDAIYGKEADEQIKIEEAEKANADNKPTPEAKKRGRKPKK